MRHSLPVPLPPEKLSRAAQAPGGQRLVAPSANHQVLHLAPELVGIELLAGDSLMNLLQIRQGEFFLK